MSQRLSLQYPSTKSDPTLNSKILAPFWIARFYCWIPVLRHLEGRTIICCIYAGEQASGFLETKVVAINIVGWLLFFPANRKLSETSGVKETSCPTDHALRHRLERPAANFQLLFYLTRTKEPWPQPVETSFVKSPKSSQMGGANLGDNIVPVGLNGEDRQRPMWASGQLGPHKQTDSCHMLMMTLKYLQLKAGL